MRVLKSNIGRTKLRSSLQSVVSIPGKVSDSSFRKNKVDTKGTLSRTAQTERATMTMEHPSVLSTKHSTWRIGEMCQVRYLE